MSNNKLKWYVVHTLTNSEKRAKKLLDIEIKQAIEAKAEVSEMFGNPWSENQDGVEEYKSPVLVPESRVVYDGSKERSIVKFPGYLFINCVLNDTSKTIIRETNRISKINEAPLKKREVDNLLGIKQKKEEVAEIQLSVNIGEDVEIIDGPFKSMIAKIEDIDKKNKKVTVGVKMFGRTNNVDLKFSQVQKTAPNADQQ
jgi:transcription termination/antitermination protein NusG